jgi:ketosteroid isomerase-like protein
MSKNVILLLATMVAAFAAAPADAVRDAASAWTEAVLKQHQGALERLVAKNLYFAHADGKSVQTKSDYLAFILKGAPRYESFGLKDAPLIVVYDNTAVVSTYVDTKEPGREPIVLRLMQLYVENDRKWQLVASAATPVRSPGSAGQQTGSIPGASSSYSRPDAVDTGSGKAVREAALGWTDAAVRKDRVAMEQHLADELIFVHSNGSTIQNKAQYLAATERNTYEALPMSNVNVQTFGNTAVLTAYIDTKNIGREPFRVRTLQVFIERNGKWRLAAFQSTRVAPNQ